MKALIKEIFSSIQGEGIYIGEPQVFVRFTGCNLNCKYCDTDFSDFGAKNYTSIQFLEEISKYIPQTVSLTGGEPLLNVPFLLEVLPQLKKTGKKIYLETNGTLFKELEKIIDYVDIVAMDIKIESATKQKARYDANRIFLNLRFKRIKKRLLRLFILRKLNMRKLLRL